MPCLSGWVERGAGGVGHDLEKTDPGVLPRTPQTGEQERGHTPSSEIWVRSPHPHCWGSTQVGVESERKPELGGFTDLALGPCACPPIEDPGRKDDAQHPES